MSGISRNGRSGLAGLFVVLALAMVMTPAFAQETSRLKDLAFLEGTTEEPLVGYGLVVGLNGTGDSYSVENTANSIAMLLEKLDVTISPRDLKAKNVAAVIVTGTLDPNINVGGRIDVKVNSLNDATSLEGGHLIMTPLRAADGTLCVLAQGSVSIGGFNVKSGAGNSYRKNHTQAGLVTNGGSVKVELGGSFIRGGRVAWLLHNPDFVTAAAVAAAINGSFGDGTAIAQDAQRIQVIIPEEENVDPIGFIARMSEIESRSDAVARVVVNERTGTIIVGKNVKLKEAAVAHGNLKVIVSTYYDVSQPSSFSRRGDTVVVPEVNTDVDDQHAQVLRVPDTSTVADVVGVLNDIGASPRDIIAILEALKRAGSLQAELILM
ncbi:MAG: flagellar basal body P-ring protein FlgI [Candidatus Krumholzibacteria bacterium]|nr:flagellar basal body P-ring protein FlgI [Candidatus Krumholzibacteria bacterium]